MVPFKFGEKSAKALSSSGFQDVTFKAYDGCAILIFALKNCVLGICCYCNYELSFFPKLCRLGHYTIPEEMDDLCAWLTSKLGLEGSS